MLNNQLLSNFADGKDTQEQPLHSDKHYTEKLSDQKESRDQNTEINNQIPNLHEKDK